MGNEFSGSHSRLCMPSNTFLTFTVGECEPVRIFHPREYLALLAITQHKFLPFYSTVRLFWTSSNYTELTHQSPIVVLILNHAFTPMKCDVPVQCNVIYHYMSMSCHVCIECHMDNLFHTFNHVSWIIILHAYNFQNNNSFQCQHISIHILTFIKQ